MANEDTNTLNNLKFQQAERLFEELANLAYRLESISVGMVGYEIHDPIPHEELALTAKYLSRQIGVLSDFGCGLINNTGRGTVRGGIENWLIDGRFPKASDIDKEGVPA